MIDAKELRLGNLVYNSKGEIDRIEGIVPTTKGGVVYLESMVGVTPVFDPITLTEEILIRCGFVCKPKTLSIINKTGHCTMELARENFTFIHKDGKAVIKYLHQLQNLYFALTGEELEFKS